MAYLGTPYITETQATAFGDQIVEKSAAAEAAQFGMANVFTPVVAFNFAYKDQIVQLSAGNPFVPQDGLKINMEATILPWVKGSLSQSLVFSFPANSTNIAALFGGF